MLGTNASGVWNNIRCTHSVSSHSRIKNVWKCVYKRNIANILLQGTYQINRWLNNESTSIHVTQTWKSLFFIKNRNSSEIFQSVTHSVLDPGHQGISRRNKKTGTNKDNWKLKSLLVLIIFVFGSMLQDTGELHIVKVAFLINWSFSIHLVYFLICKTITHGGKQFTQVIFMNEACIRDEEGKGGLRCVH